VESLYLKTLVEVVRTGSLSRAAETLHVTQPAVSRRVKFMEDQYGCALLDRSGHTLRPTEAGRLVYEKARALLEIEADLVSGLQTLDGRARISFSCTPSFGIAHLPMVLREFMLACADRADLKFIFNTPEDILAGLEDGTFDLAVMELCERFDLSPYTSFALPGDEMVFVSSPNAALVPRATKIETLFDIPLYARREGCCSRLLLENNLTCLGHDLQHFHKVIVFDDLHIIVKAVLDGQGIAFLSRDVLEDHLASGRLVAHYVEGFKHDRERALILGHGTAMSGPHGQFTTALFNHFGVSVPDTPPASGPLLRPAAVPEPPAPVTPPAVPSVPARRPATRTGPASSR
jgi:DNA-binding transcriptional LysR family regulator